MTPPLDDADLAYMREVQAEHRPTAATLKARAETPDGMGGTTTTDAADGDPIQVRLDGTAKVPDHLAQQYDVGLTKVVMDLVPVHAGDRIVVGPAEAYRVVSQGDPDRWATAQVVWAVREGAAP